LAAIFYQNGMVPDLSQYSCQIFAEIVDASDLSVEAILALPRFRLPGRNVIDCRLANRLVHLKDHSNPKPPGRKSVDLCALDLLAGR
jgi:hypothetical protein